MSPPRTANGISRSETNRVQPEDRPIHEWYRFVLSFPPHLVRALLERFELTKKKLVLDPFCGTGTTLVECKKRGIPSVGIEANPLAHFASSVKLDWRPDPDGLLAYALRVADATAARLETEGIEDSPVFPAGPRPDQPLRSLPP